MSKEKKKKPFYKRWWVWVIAIIIVFAALSGGDDTETGPKQVDSEAKEVDAANTNETNNNSNEDEKDFEKTEFDIGEKVELDGHVVEVTNVEKSAGDDFDKPKEGKEFVIITVSIENNAEKEISYNPFDFKMQNSQGQIEDTTFTIIDSDTSLSSGNLAPGGNVSGTIAFEQPKDDPELQLQFEPSFWSSDKIIFNLQ